MGVRAYPALEAMGDQGWLGTVELRQALGPKWQATLFYDYGAVQPDKSSGYAGSHPLHRVALQGAGLGLGWSQPSGWSVRTSVAHRIGDNPLAATSTGRNTDGSRAGVRWWVSATRFF